MWRTRPGVAALTGGALAVLALTVLPQGSLAKDTVKIAWIGPLTGALSAHGIGGRNSAELAVKLKNADPAARYNYELVALDDECKPNVGVQVATRAGSDRSIIAAVPHYCSATAIATVEVYNRFKLPVVVWAAVLPEITYGKKLPEIHRVSGTLIGQNKVGAKFMTDLGYKRFVSLCDTTDYGKSMDKYFTQFTLENGGEVIGKFGVPPDQQDLSAELTQIKDLNPEAIFFGGLTPLGTRLRTQMVKFGMDQLMEGQSGIIGDAFINAVGRELAEGVLSFFDSSRVEKSEAGKDFIKKYADAGYKEPYEAYGPFSFAATNLVMDKIEQAGPDRAKVTEALAQVKDYPSAVGPITFDDYGQNITPLTTKFVVQDGKWVPWEDSEYATGKRKLNRQK
jgi:branched-chain amino acid transport system substrate-binding protein